MKRDATPGPLSLSATLLGCAGLSLFSVTPPIVAQEQSEPIEEVVTIGSRVAGRTATEATVPIDVIQSEALTKSGFTELGQSLQTTAPSFNFSRTQISDGGDLYRPATLRGLQPDQTLVLVNGKRRHNQAIFQLANSVGGGAAGTDMNSIPLTAIQAVEVLRDGAAAQYGSDAIAGVINLKLKDTTDVTSGFVQWGQTEEGDGDTLTVGINTGFELGTEGGFMNVSLEYRDFDSTNRAHPGWFQGDAEGDFATFFYNAALPVGNGEVYSFGGYSERTGTGAGFRRAADAAAQNVPQVTPDGFLPNIANTAEDISFALGYRQELVGEWTMDFSFVYGDNDYEFDSENTINASIAAEFFENSGRMATDAEIAANAGPREGFSGARGFDQLTFNVDIAGSVDWGGEPLYIAFGAEQRNESANSGAGVLASYSCGSSPDPVAIPSVIDPSVAAGCGFQAFSGIAPTEVVDASRESFALYLDLERNMAESWLLGVAARYEDYDVFGDELTGKISTRVDLAENFAVRGAVATGFRAPALQQSSFQAFQTNINDAGVLERSFTAAAGSAFPVAVGVTNLDFETSTSFSLGFVWNPTESITVTVDAYSVEIEDRIVLGGLVDRDAVAGNAAAIAVLDELGVNGISFFSNAVDTTTEGVDVIVTYDTELAEGDLSITLAANINETEIDRFNVPPGSTADLVYPPVNRSFLTHGQPQERGTLSLNWSRNAFSVLLRANYFGETEVDFFAMNHIGIPGTLPTSVVEDNTLVDIDLSYDVTENLTASVGGNNIFDEQPDELGNNEVLTLIAGGPGSGFIFPVRAVPYGFNGASYYVKLAFSF